MAAGEMKRCWHVKVKGQAAFVMLIMEGDESAESICRSIFGERLEWVK